MELHLIYKIVSSYLHLASQAYGSLRNRYLYYSVHDNLQWFLLDQPLVPVLLTAHALFASLNVFRITKGRQFWLKSFVLTMFAAFGGSTLASVLCARPPPLFTKSSNTMVVHITIAWYIINQSKLLRALLSFAPVSALLSFTAMAAKSRTIFVFIDEYNRRFRHQAAGAILLGGLAGCGGSFFITVERIVQQGFSASSELSAPGWGFKSAYIAAACYYIATDPHMLLRNWLIPLQYAVDKREARFWIALALCLHAGLESLIGRHINVVFLLEELFFAVTGVRKYTESDDGAGRRIVDGDECLDAGDGEEAHHVEPSESVKRAWTARDLNGLRRRRNTNA